MALLSILPKAYRFPKGPRKKYQRVLPGFLLRARTETSTRRRVMRITAPMPPDAPVPAGMLSGDSRSREAGRRPPGGFLLMFIA
jgi:hypothetical protein